MIRYDREREDEPGYDPLTGAYHLQHDWESPERLSQTVTEIILVLADQEPSAWPPLSESIDPDALNQLFGPARADGRGARDHVTFTHQNCTVTVHRDGHVVAYPPAATGKVRRNGVPGP